MQSRTTLAVVLFLVTTGCGGGSIANRSVSNVGNLFTFSADLKGGYTGSDHESWSPTTQLAWIAWDGTSVTAGEVNLQILDAQGTSVASESAKPGSVPAGQASTQGTPGNWSVEITFTGTTGHLALNVQGSI